jgi:dephospho-CoA kinase
MLIGIAGKKGSGKDTIADYICKNYNYIKYSFATPLKQTLQTMFNLTNKQLYDEKEKEIVDKRYGKSPRELMQWFGTDIMRDQLTKFMPSMGENLWVNHFEEFYLENSVKENVPIIIADVRFQNEIDVIHKLGGVIIRIDRFGLTNIDTHITEQTDTLHLGGNDFIIQNDSTLNNLYKKIDKLKLLIK